MAGDFGDVLALIKSNMLFPSYQADRRIDIFLNLFLEICTTRKAGC